MVQLALLFTVPVPADGDKAAVCQNRALNCREMCLLPRRRCCNPQQGSAEALVWSRAAQSSTQWHPGLWAGWSVLMELLDPSSNIPFLFPVCLILRIHPLVQEALNEHHHALNITP